MDNRVQVPPQPTQNIPTSGPRAITGNLTQLPQSFADAAVGTVIKGEIVGHTKSGATQIKTDFGTLEVTLTKQIPVGGKVSLEIQTQGTAFRVSVLSYDAPKEGQAPLPPTGGHAGPTKDVVAVPDNPKNPAGQDGKPSGQQSQATQPAKPPLQVGETVVARSTSLVREFGSPQQNAQADSPKYTPPPVFQSVASNNKGALANAAAFKPAAIPSPAAGEATVKQGEAAKPTPAPASSSAPSPSGAQNAPASSSAGVRVGASLSPEVLATAQSAGSGTNTPPASNSAASAAPPSSAPAPSTTSPAVSQPVVEKPLTQGAQQSIKVVQILKPDQAVPATLAAPQTAAKLVGNNAQGQAVLQTSLNTYVVDKSAAQLPVGTTVVIEPTEAAAPKAPAKSGAAQTAQASQAPQSPQSSQSAAAKSPFPDLKPPLLPTTGPLPPLEVLELPRLLPVLEGGLMAQQAITSTPVPPLMQASIPTPSPDMGKSLLFLLAALKGGVPATQFIPPKARAALPPDAMQALNTLDAEFQNMAQRLRGENLTSQPAAQGQTAQEDWKAFQLPVYNGQAYEMVSFYTRREHQDDSADFPNEYTRMVIELDLSELGPLQLDNVFSNKRFDLFFKSARPLPVPAQQGLHHLFFDLLEAAGFHGTLSFSSLNAAA